MLWFLCFSKIILANKILAKKNLIPNNFWTQKISHWVCVGWGGGRGVGAKSFSRQPQLSLLHCLEVFQKNFFWQTNKTNVTNELMSVWYYQTDVMLSGLCDTLYHVCMILHLRQVLNTEKNIWQIGSLLVVATQSVYLPKIHFKLFLEEKTFHSFLENWNI